MTDGAFGRHGRAPPDFRIAMTSHVSAATQVANFTLKNGLELVVIPDHRAPVVTHMVWYRNGAADDPPGKSGIAHFLEHLMFKGTKAHPKGEFSEFISEVGGQENAFTGSDFTAYFQQVARQHLKACMEFEADRMTGLVLTDAIVAPERDVVLEERRMHCDTDPGAQLGEAVQATLFTHHPYGIPIIGWGHEIEGLKREDALAYYQRFYTPENAILVVAGDAEPEETLALAEETYGKVKPRGAKPERDPLARTADGREPGRHGVGRRRSSSRTGSATISRPRAAPRSPANRRRSTCSAIFSAAARRASSTARSSWKRSSRSRPGPITTARRSTRAGSSST